MSSPRDTGKTQPPASSDETDVKRELSQDELKAIAAGRKQITREEWERLAASGDFQK